MTDLAAHLAAMKQRIGAPWVAEFENFDGGHPFIEVSDGPVYRYLAYERGKQLFARETTELDEILYWAMYDATWSMAWGYAVQHPVDGEEQRFTAFRRQDELLAQLNPAWVGRTSRPS